MSLLLWVALIRGITVHRDLYGSPMETPNTSHGLQLRSVTNKSGLNRLKDNVKEPTSLRTRGCSPFGRCANARAGEVINSVAKFDCGRGGFKLLLTKIRHTISPKDTDLW